MNKYFFGEHKIHYNADPLLHVIVKEINEAIRKAFLSLDEEAKNILHLSILEGKILPNINLEKYLTILNERFFYYYN